MSGKYFLVDTTRCIACRGCQVACKQWNKLPGVRTRQWGSPQNPPDLNAHTYRLVRFREYQRARSIVRYYFTDACRHCLEPPCKDEADSYVPDAIRIDPSGAVLFTGKTKALGENAQNVINACPYNIPRLDPDTGTLTKCHMCYRRIRNNMEPSCVKTCPTGALKFGERKEIMALALERLGKTKNKFGKKADLVNSGEVRVIYLLADDPEYYHEFAEG
ncbi:MAG: 4Fe-4S dicluster domain-containing protein [Deltaproteobacteria bacterium]|nr:4Fe-4S dicluster domain-containing protein [Deltaproteobacteria bacterium]